MADSTPASSPSPELSTAAVLRRLLGLTWGYRYHAALLLVAQVVLLALGVSSLFSAGLAFDIIRYHVQPGVAAPAWPFGLTPPTTWTPLVLIAVASGATLGLALVRSLLTYVYSLGLGNLIHQKMVVDLRRRVYDKLQRLSFRFFDARDSGSIINRVTFDVQSTRMFVDTVIIHGIVLVLSIAVYLVYMVRIHVWLTLVCLATTPVLLIASSIFSRRMRADYTRTRELMDHLMLVVSENVQGIHVVKGFAREAERIALFEKANRAVREQQRRIFWRVTIFSPAMTALTRLNTAAVLLYGGWLVVTGSIALGTGLIVFIGLLGHVSGQIGEIANIANTIQQCFVAARRVFEILDAPLEVATPPAPARLGGARGAVTFDRVGFAYRPGEIVLDGVSFDVPAGHCIGIMGATGSGKSTLLSLIPRFYDATAGRVLVDGHDVRELDLDELRKAIGLVFQETFLFSNTVAANIAFGHPHASREQVERAARVAAAHEFIEVLPRGYDTILGEAGVDLSGGQRQRLAIARAVLLEPPILLLDDPTAAIDAQTEREILEAIDRAIAGRTTFIVANRISVLRRARTILVMQRGRLVESGTHDELLSRGGLYRDVAELQLSTSPQNTGGCPR